MNTISKKNDNILLCKLPFGLIIFTSIVISFLFVSCGFDGPWSYYPEKRDVYTGIYTYGYIIEGEPPYICFSKVYQLEESSAENFAFYDSSYVSVTGKFYAGGYDVEERELILKPEKGKPNCFVSPLSSVEGVASETYTMRAFFKWDSAGHKTETEYTAEGTIPTGFGLNGVNVPLAGGKYKWFNVSQNLSEDGFTYSQLFVDFLEYPDDVNLYKFSMKYNDSIGGVLMYIEYDKNEGGENMNTTINAMLSGFLKPDSSGYTGISIRDGIEGHANMGYEENRRTAGLNMLDTIYVPNMTLSLGNNNLYFLATDDAYMKYRRYVMGAFDDSRVIPESNIKNGMGVFSGMTKLVLPLHIAGSGVAYWYIAAYNCINSDDDKTIGWESKICRLYQDVYCTNMSDKLIGYEGDLYELNEIAYTYYSKSDSLLKFLEHKDYKFCYASAIKAAMMLDSSSWSVFLPKNIDAKDKHEAYGDALKRYCVTSNFSSIKIADCSEIKKQCIEDDEKNSCKTYLWQWCDDRNWDMEKYPQCIEGFVSRYYLENQNSSILKREVEKICNSKMGEIIKPCERE